MMCEALADGDGGRNSIKRRMNMPGNRKLMKERPWGDKPVKIG